jgi:DNA-binding response OmpR family regulator
MAADKRKTVLVADRADSFVGYLRIVLGRLGYSVRQSTSESETLGLARQTFPDLVISESNLGEGSGISLLRSMRASQATAFIPFFLLTTDGSPEVRKSAIEAGACACLTKPLNVRALYHALEDQLERRRRQYIRLPISLLVKVETTEGDLAYQTQSFGEGGLFLKTHKPMPLGTQLKMIVHLPDREPPLPLQGEVIHSIFPPVRGGHSGMCVKFTDVPRPVKCLLSAFMEATLISDTPLARETAMMRVSAN